MFKCNFKGTSRHCFSKVWLTQNTRLIRLATRVNRSYNRTNRDLSYIWVLRVYLWKPCIIFKIKKNMHGWHVYVWSYRRSYKNARYHVRPYETVFTTVHEVYSTSVHIRFHTIAILSKTNTVQVRIKHDQVWSDRVYHRNTWSFSLIMISNSLILSYVASNNVFINII